jgi:2-phosphoglycerate kinase
MILGHIKRQMKQDFAHVLWIGGSPCSGKSSVAEILAEKYDLSVYRCDDAFAEHVRRADPDRHPTLYRLTRMTWDEIWRRPVDVQIADEFACYREEFAMIVDDLMGYPRSTPVVAEGAALLPECVSCVLPDHHRAVWVVPTEAFQRGHYTLERRPWMREILDQCEDPAQAFHNWMDRDAGFARSVVKSVRELDLTVLEVDGERTLAENVDVIARHLQLVEG